MKNKKYKILLLSAGLNAAYHFSKILKEKFSNDFMLVGADINEQYLVSACNLFDKFYKVPLSNSPEYYKTILNIIKKEKIDYLIPTYDKDQNLFYPENKDLISLRVKSISTPLETLKFYRKDLIIEKLKAEGIKVPKIYSVKDILDNQSYIIKPKEGSGSIGVKKLKGSEIKNIADTDNYIIQEICKEPEITLECFYHNNILSSVARERIASKSGVCTKTRIWHNSELESIVKVFIDKIKTGPFFNLQFMVNDKNEYVITDVNLRLAGGMSLSHAAGWDEASAILNLLLKKSDKKIFLSLKLNAPEQYIIRAYQDIITKKSETIAFDLDGTILNSFDRHIIVLKKAFNVYKINLNIDDYIEFKRKGYSNIQYLKYKGLNDDIINKIQSYWIKNIEKEEYLINDFIYPGAENILKTLSKKYSLILITGRNNKKNCNRQLKKLKLDKYFSKIFIVNTNQFSSQLKADILIKENCIEMWGDTETEIDSCKIAGIKYKALYWGFRNKDFIKCRRNK